MDNTALTLDKEDADYKADLLADRIFERRDELIQDMLRDEVAVVDSGLVSYASKIDEATGAVIDANPDYIEQLLIALAQREFGDVRPIIEKGRLEVDRILRILALAMETKLEEACEQLAQKEST